MQRAILQSNLTSVTRIWAAAGLVLCIFIPETWRGKSSYAGR